MAAVEERARDLPLAWRIAVSRCPYCRGLDPEMGSCDHCDRTGDLLGAMLADAYRQGVEDGLVKLRELYGVLLLAGRQLGTPTRTVEQLRRSVGL
jgi:hypothetical protein